MAMTNMIASTGLEIGSVVALAIRPERKAAPRQVARFEAITDTGISGDIHANKHSPRQVLLASALAYQELLLPQHSLRENVLVDLDTSELSSGSIIQLGSDARLWLTFQCEACGHLNDHQAALSRNIGNRRGILARVLTGGTISSGDRIYLLNERMPSWSDDWRNRIAHVLESVPKDCVIEYKSLARLAGVPSSYCRVFPRFIKMLGTSYAGKAIPVLSKSKKARWHGEGYFRTRPHLLLPQEGVSLESNYNQMMDENYEFAYDR